MHACLPLWNTILVTGDGKFPWPMASVRDVSATDTLHACAEQRQSRLQEWDVFGVMFDSTVSEPQVMVYSLQSSR